MSFEAGARVRTRDRRSGGHTRLPAYLARKPAIVVRSLGAYALPDEAAVDSQTARRSALYTCSFDAKDVWNDAAASGVIYADLFEEYLEPAP